MKTRFSKTTITTVGIATLTALLLTGCSAVVQENGYPGTVGSASTPNSAPTTPSTTTPTPTSSPTASASPAAPTTTSEYTLIQEPNAGFSPIYTLINSAKTSIDMTMYELADSQAQSDLIAAHNRGVKVRVLLDSAFNGTKVNSAAATQLTAAGVTVKWAYDYTIFHQKTITIDGTVSAIGTANLTAQYYSTSRDAWIIDRNITQVNAIEETFNNDINHTQSSEGTTVQAPGLLWSPGAAAGMVAAISAAKTSVDFTSEELAYTPVINALAADAKRGVKCEIVLTKSSEWNSGFATDTAAGCSVHVFPDSTTALYIHEKIVLTDGNNLLIGSQNASTYSLTRNRELSVELNNSNAPAVISAVTTTFNADYANSSPWTK